MNETTAPPRKTAPLTALVRLYAVLGLVIASLLGILLVFDLVPADILASVFVKIVLALLILAASTAAVVFLIKSR